MGQEDQEDEKEAGQQDDDDDDDNFTNEVLHVLQDVGVSDALAYVASLLYDEPNNGRRIGSTPAPAYLAQLPGHTPKTSAKRGKILSAYPLAVPGGGRFSCLVEALSPNCNCGWSLTQRIASPTNDEASLHEFPSMAGVLTKKQGKVFCGAAISKWTAWHIVNFNSYQQDFPFLQFIIITCSRRHTVSSVQRRTTPLCCASWWANTICPAPTRPFSRVATIWTR